MEKLVPPVHPAASVACSCKFDDPCHNGGRSSVKTPPCASENPKTSDLAGICMIDRGALVRFREAVGDISRHMTCPCTQLALNVEMSLSCSCPPPLIQHNHPPPCIPVTCATAIHQQFKLTLLFRLTTSSPFRNQKRAHVNAAISAMVLRTHVRFKFHTSQSTHPTGKVPVPSIVFVHVHILSFPACPSSPP